MIPLAGGPPNEAGMGLGCLVGCRRAFSSFVAGQPRQCIFLGIPRAMAGSWGSLIPNFGQLKTHHYRQPRFKTKMARRQGENAGVPW